MNKKAITEVVFSIFVILVAVLAVVLIWRILFPIMSPTAPLCHQKQVSASELLTVLEHDTSYFDYRVNNYSIENAIPSNALEESICTDLLNTRLSAVLNKSDNLYFKVLDARFDTAEAHDFLCPYTLYGRQLGVGEDDDFVVYTAIERFSNLEYYLSAEKQPAFNKSLVKVYWDENLRATVMKNYNRDYYVIGLLFYNDTVEVCE